MELEFAGLTLDEEEGAVLQIQDDPNSIREEEVLNLVGCFLTASIIHFLAMKSTMANLWHPVRGVQIRDMGEKSDPFIIGGCQEASRPVAMKILSWNVRGLGNPRTVRRLRHSLKLHYPQMVFFMETKINKYQMEKVRRSCDFLFDIDVDSIGSKGGLSLAWRGDVNIML
ncbi:hypothetical protein CXB51_020029 [Gossypium anomalum]|uniref:Endonuclease/exonuclease/phosphatase domain-containing protein n=1 Tax=Gossypium anomalum TaxID=47600 RepID=A0A8J6CY63_9ROSI|nr:hypothetical protein CXB51_020029 [Gossypium anomalum]